jgi:ABC-type dipeptide/oligopeptide/nickel transport system ATPase component
MRVPSNCSARVGLNQPALRASQYPHELSGGMKQRVLIAIAIALKPALIIADEPTSALDVTVQKRILDLIDELRREYGTAVLLVTHDLGVAADRADRLIVLKGGRIQEQGRPPICWRNPRSAYTRSCWPMRPRWRRRVALPPEPRRRKRKTTSPSSSKHLVQDFAWAAGKRFRAVDDVSFRVRRGTTHALVGESGSGKTTTIRDVVGFQKPTAGRRVIVGARRPRLRGEALRQFRKKIQLVYQNPFGSLDPRQTIFQIVEEPLLNFDPLPPPSARRACRTSREGRPAARRAAAPAACAVRRPAPARRHRPCAGARPADPGAGRSRVGARRHRAGADPALLDTLQRELGLTYLFISHDLAVVRQISDTVSVLHNGRQVDSGRVEDVFLRPQQRLHARTHRRDPRAKGIPILFPQAHPAPRLLHPASGRRHRRRALPPGTEQIVHAEPLGFDSAWVAQHHFHEAEGGLPSPLVFLASVAARTSRIRLGTGIITLPLENPVRVAEDAVVLDLLSGGRLEFGVGTGGTPSSFTAFGQDSEQRATVFASHLAQLREAWAGRPLLGGDRLYPVSAQTCPTASGRPPSRSAAVRARAWPATA